MRNYTKFGKADPEAAKLVDALAEIKDSPQTYRNQMQQIGKHLAQGIRPLLTKSSTDDICVICTVEDADFLARGLIESLEQDGFGKRIHLLCLWNGKIKEESVSLSPVLREYKEEIRSNNSIFIVVKSIISGACVVKTNLARAISMSKPTKIYVAAPVMLIGAEERLSREFPPEINAKFEFVHFATDDEKDGDDVRPGIGGSVYELLGLGNSVEKNKYVPLIVKERRAKHYGVPVPATA